MAKTGKNYGVQECCSRANAAGPDDLKSLLQPKQFCERHIFYRLEFTYIYLQLVINRTEDI